MNDNIILSIVIPTRNRVDYTFNVVEQILAIKETNFQLVVQDNSDSNELEQRLKIYEFDKRLNYYYDNRVLSFVDNFNEGVDKSIGEYLIILGDDDGVIPDILQIAEWARNNNIEAITPSLPFIYFWPNSGVKNVDETGTLTINDFSCNIKVIKTKRVIKSFLRNGCHNYLEYDMAKLYHGLIKKTVLEKIKFKTGKFIGGLSPDIYLSVAISLTIESVVLLDFPLTISGICKNSGSSDSATGRHTGKLESAPHFRGRNGYAWSKSVPPFYSVETIWADSALAAIKEMSCSSYLKYYNSNVLIVRCLKKYKEFHKLIIDYVKQNNLKFFYVMFLGQLQIIKYKKSRFVRRIYNRMQFKNKPILINNVSDIIYASELCNRFVSENKGRMMRKIQNFKK